MYEVAELVNLILDIYFWIIIVRIFLTWIPSINWNNQPFTLLAQAADIILNPFRKIVPPIGMLDISPIVALIVYQIVHQLIIRLLLAFA